MKKLLTILLFISPFITQVGYSQLSEPAAIRYHDSGVYQQDIERVIHQAREFITLQAKQNQARKQPKKLAVIFDIDETALSNYHNMQTLHFKQNGDTLRAYLEQGNDPAILPSLNLYRTIQKHQIAVFFITGRDELLHHATIVNLLKAGYQNWSGAYFKPRLYDKNSIIPFKSCVRKRIEKMGFTIIASIGDQKSDYLGGHTIRGFKLPNPFYHID